MKMALSSYASVISNFSLSSGTMSQSASISSQKTDSSPSSTTTPIFASHSALDLERHAAYSLPPPLCHIAATAFPILEHRLGIVATDKA